MGAGGLESISETREMEDWETQFLGCCCWEEEEEGAGPELAAG